MSRVRGGDQSEKSGAELDMLSWMGRTTLEVLGQAGLGYSFDPLTEDVADEFASAVKSFLCVRSLPLFLLPRLITHVRQPPAHQVGHPANLPAHRGEARPGLVPAARRGHAAEPEHPAYEGHL